VSGKLADRCMDLEFSSLRVDRSMDRAGAAIHGGFLYGAELCGLIAFGRKSQSIFDFAKTNGYQIKPRGLRKLTA